MAGDGKLEIADQGVEEFRGRGLADDSVIPFLGESDERFGGHAVEGDQGFVGFGVLGRVIVEICPEIFDPGEGVMWVVWAIARVDSGDRSIGGPHSVSGDSKEGKGRGEHGIWGARDVWGLRVTRMGSRLLGLGAGGGPTSK